MPAESPNSIFVYGTLKRGEVREGCWPSAPQQVIVSRIQGQLFDLGPYPAVIHGSDWIEGERWIFKAHEIRLTLAILDTIEGCGQDDEPDLYRREIVRCVDVDGSAHAAFTYFYAHPQGLRSETRCAPNDDGVCAWIPLPSQRTLDD